MNNTYLFIIWNKALWCKDKILKDLSNSFNIVSSLYIKWSYENFENNLKSLYGRKLGNPNEKIQPCGKGPFLLILVEDPSPDLKERKMYDGTEFVNANIYDKKMLYRKWTGGCHRIHCSDTQKETEHDLAVIFGANYNNYLNEDSQSLNLDTKSVRGFDSIDDLYDCLKLFGNNRLYIEGNKAFIFSKCQYDIVSFIKAKKIKNNLYSLKIKDTDYNIFIFGELDGNLPKGYLNKEDKDDLIINHTDLYLNYLNNRDQLDDIYKNEFEKLGLEVSFKPIKVERNFKKPNILKNEIKLLQAKLSLKN